MALIFVECEKLCIHLRAWDNLAFANERTEVYAEIEPAAPP